MAFVTRTRLVQIATGTLANKIVLAQPTVFRTSAVGTTAETVDTAMLIVPAGQRPAQADWWQYIVQQEVGYVVRPTVRGLLADDPTGRSLVYDAAFWETIAQQAGAPLRWNTFTHQFIPRAASGAQAAIRASMEDFLIRAHFNPAIPADYRDSTIQIVTSPDPLGLLGRVADDDGVVRESLSRWRSA